MKRSPERRRVRTTLRQISKTLRREFRTWKEYNAFQLAKSEAAIKAHLFPVEQVAQLEQDLAITQNALAADKSAIAQGQRRISDLLNANNAEVEKRRRFEAEANQQHCENILLRNELMRLREVHSILAGHIEECYQNGGETPPDEIAAALQAVFPPDAGGAKC